LKNQISLDGVVGAEGKSLQLIDHSQSIAFSAPTAVLEVNPCRKWAMIQNSTDAPSDYLVYLVEGNTGLTALMLVPGGTLQIDENFPFTGMVRACPLAGTFGIRVIEAVVQP